MPNYWVFSDFGLKQVMESLRSGTLTNYLNGLKIGLFVNNHTPAHGDANSAFTQPTDAWYATQNTNAWGAAATNSSPPDADVTDATHTWTGSGTVTSNTIYGVLLLDSSNNWIAAQYTNLSSPAVIDAVGKSYQFTPRLTGANYSGYP